MKVLAQLVTWIVLVGGTDLLIAALAPDLNRWVRLALAVSLITAIVTGYDVAREKRDSAASSEGPKQSD